ncbi:N-acetylmuramoyl-L-alanine amidase [Selenomonas sp. CM52]|uniref:N-acetylmuramoyl-L-alanine amidase n=1 Tax=Selenomonas sp. CM52 TaxID=936381 RepID=UPI00027C5A2A|nr:N-acetylmuramoyl-L-alanine amidase [Selenomonas sp. CM52]EJU30863.1 putative N-acetylmuramoyl-L-alanine amidase CwlD [Selenomonas sp. CM52]
MNVSFRWLFFFVFAAVVFFLSFPAFPTAQAAPLAQIKNVRVHADKEKVRIVVDADGEVDYKSMTLASPGRVVVDLSGARLSPSVAKSQKIESQFATKVRLGQFDSTTVRIVVETEMYKSSSNYDVFSLEGGPVPYRVVMDFGNLSGSAGSSASSAGGTSSGGSNIDFGHETGSSDDSGSSSDGGQSSSGMTRSRSQSSAAPGIDGKRIVLDPGHGGSDTGAIGPTGVTEKSIALRIAKRLKTLLEAEGAEVILTRTEDTEVSPKKAKATDVEELQARCDIANQNSADIFLSIHLDAFSGPEAHGTTGYYYEMGSADSTRLADCVKRGVLRRLGTLDRGTKPCAFYVCRHTDMPAMLLETAFVSNPREEQMMNSEEGVENAAQGIAAGIAEYFQ